MRIPRLVYANKKGQILDHPTFSMLAARGSNWFVPENSDLIPLPEESELFFLPGRKAVGLNPATGQHCQIDGNAVAAFAAPAHTLIAHPACQQSKDAPTLPLFAYGAVGYAEKRFWICARKVDADARQQFRNIPPRAIANNARKLLQKHPENRLLAHIINNCVARYDCPAAKNFALGRFEAPLPTARSCNAHCVGCISSTHAGNAVSTTPQCRLAFTPNVSEIVEIMSIHEQRERKVPVYSFGQGCEGDPLQNWPLLAESIGEFRNLQKTGAGHGTINCNTNASITEGVEALCKAGLTSLRVSLNSAVPEIYEAYYRPANYNFENVTASIHMAAKRGIFVSLNFLWFPGISDRESELLALAELCRKNGVSMIQWRNLNIDPYWYLNYMAPELKKEKSMGLCKFQEALRKLCPWLRYGYFNPWLGDKATLRIPKI